PPSGEHATQALTSPATGGTIALPMGVGTEVAEDGRRPRRRRRRFVVLAIVLALLGALVGYGYWWLNFGPGAYTNVPTGLVGSSADAASEALTSFGLGVTTDESFDDDVPAGDVISTDPAEGQRIPKEGAVELLVSLGVEHFAVPSDLVGQDLTAVTAALEGAGLTVGPAEKVYDDTVPAGVVMALSAEAGDQVPHNTPIVPTVSDGPAPVTVPQVVNSATDDAVASLEREGLKVTVEEEYSDTVPEGRVVRQSPGSGSAAKRTDTVTIVVSLGREPVAVPNVEGMTTQAAHEALEALELVPVDQFAWGGFLGQVRFQSVAAGEMVPKGTSVTLTIF
ncbi:MAG: PASTA domain-containing protein, partial [Cellulomonadaceae bacterium]